MNERLLSWLSLVTNILMAPVLVALVVMMSATLWMIGGLAREALDRVRGRRAWRKAIEKVGSGVSHLGLIERGDLPSEMARILLRLDRCAAPAARKVLDDIELEMARRLAWLSFATKVGPMIGLVGTLLPLGPALRGLASESLGELVRELEIAFTSTVFGLVIGGLTYAASILRRNWYDQDVSDLQFVLDAVSPGARDTCSHPLESADA
ncbi:MotA/TolQ/ExbB proton channel family protein [Aquisphaera insulae]|uniref:MotA/TolQ/ExbB proton channel family protein n=1 Tax=Aquisphaera insulae TaxID=2712864 RepID=UPI0013EC4140|nr:MotA/TolQ/ExbB proton channel family protein [Aquisphaera insulae]